MNDDSSKRDRGGDDGVKSDRQYAPDDVAARANDADEILRLFNARMGIVNGALPPEKSINQAGGAVRNRGDAKAASAPNVRVAANVLELTPTPMVVGLGSDAHSSTHLGAYHSQAKVDERRVGVLGASRLNAEREFASDPRDETFRDSAAYAAYHGPRTPPSSVAPPPAESSFSVASEYDPKAPTKPKLRRNTSIPPAPLLFGMDRMLVWGLVLGGTFVAAIVVIVHQLTSLDTMVRIKGSASPSEHPVHDVVGPVGPIPSPAAPDSSGRSPPIGSQGHPTGTAPLPPTGSSAERIPPHRPETEKLPSKPRARTPVPDAQKERVPWIE